MEQQGRIIFQGDWVRINGTWHEVIDIVSSDVISVSGRGNIDAESHEIETLLSAKEYFASLW